MNLISIETATSKFEVINAEQIASITRDSSNVVVNLSNGHQVKTKFESIDEAIDYIFRATGDSNPLSSRRL